MQDINTPLIKAYYQALAGAIPNPVAAGFVSVYEGEEPDNETAQVYIVISDVVSNDASTSSSSDTSSSIQLAIYTWENKYNTAKTANTVAGIVYSILKPDSNTVLTLDGMQMMNLRASTDRTERVGSLAGRKYINRIIIFTQDIFIFD